MPTTKLPLLSMTTNQPLWTDDPTAGVYPNPSVFKSDYKGHFHTSRRTGHGRLTAPSLKPKVSAYLSKINLAPLEGPGRFNIPDPPPVVKRFWTRRGELAVENVPFMSISSYADHFPEKTAEHRQAYAPKHQALLSDDPFDSISTYTSDFGNRLAASANIEARETSTFWPKPAPCPGFLSWPTEASKPPQTLEPIRDEMSTKRKKRPFPTETSYTTEFHQHPYAREPPIIPPNTYVKNTAPFVSSTSYRDFFKGKEVPPEDRPIAHGRMRVRKLEEIPADPMWYEATCLTPYLEHDIPVFYKANNPQ